MAYNGGTTRNRINRYAGQRKSTIFYYYVVYLHELKFGLGIDNEPVSFSQATKSDNFIKWLNVMKKELKSINYNEDWDLVELPKESKRVICKWVFKTKRDSDGTIEQR